MTDRLTKEADGLQYSLANLRDIVFPVLDAVAARSVVEIGAEQGGFTAELLRWSSGRAARITAIDSAPTPQLRALARANPQLLLIEAMSVIALPGVGPADVFVIDGDHNYFTVSEELRLIAALAESGGAFPLVFLHDVCWPWGRRDCYYDPDTIPAEALLPYIPADQFGVWGQAALADSGIFVADREGGPRNGVLTAAEDFVSGRADLHLAVIPAFHGLGVLYAKSERWTQRLEAIIGPFDRNVLLTKLEENRIEKILAVAEQTVRYRQTWEQGVEHARNLEQGWKMSVDRIKELEAELSRSRQTL